MRNIGVTAMLVGAALGAMGGAPPASAQGMAAVEGIIRTEDGSAVSAARVTAVPAARATTASGAGYGTSTDTAGRYRIGGLPAGTYRIEINAPSHRSTAVVTATLAEGEVRILNVELNAAPIALEGVEVAGVSRSRFEQAYATTKMESVVDGDDARAFNPANAYDALRLVPGVTYNSGSRFGKPGRIRGASSWGTADVIEDFPSVREAGIGTEDGGFTADFGSTIPAIALAGIEVKKGSLGVLYGGDADGGVIVNKLRRGVPGGTAGAWIETSPLGETLYMADVGGASGSFDLYAAGKLLDGDYQDFVDEQGRVLDADNLGSGLVRAGWEPFDTGRFEFISVVGRDRIHYSLPQRDDPATEADESRSLAPNAFRSTNTSGFYGATFDHAVSRSLGYEAGYSLFHQRGIRFSVTQDLAQRDRPETSHTVFGNVYWNASPLSAVDASLKAGFEWNRHRQAEEARDSDKTQRFLDRSAFLASTLVIGDALTLSGGARRVSASDDYRESQGFWVHDLGVGYDIEPTGTRLVASRSTGYSRFKGFAYFFGAVDEAGGYDVARTSTLEGSIEQRLPSPWGDGQVTATVFRLQTDGIPVFAGSGASGVVTQDTEAEGFELSADYPLGPLATIAGSFSTQDAEVVGTDHPEGLNVGNTAGWIPRHTAAFSLAAAPHPKLDLMLMATYDAGRRRQTVDPITDDINVATAHAYTRVNMTAAWKIVSSVSLRLRLENVLDEEDLGYTLQTLNPDGSLTTSESVAVDPGRSLFVGFEFRRR